MKRLLVAMAIGFAGSVMLLTATFVLPTDSSWLTRLVFGFGDQLSGWLSRHHRVTVSEGRHHTIVLISSLAFWWGIGGILAYAGIGRSHPIKSASKCPLPTQSGHPPRRR